MDKQAKGSGFIDTLRTIGEMDYVPVKEVAIASGAGVSAGLLAALLLNKAQKNNTRSVKDNIKLYRAIESPIAGEESAIDDNIYKESSLAADLPIYGAAAAVPGYVALSAIRNSKERDEIDEERKEVGELRDVVNDAYREDMLKAYGIKDEKQLSDIVKDLKTRADSLDKEASAATDALAVSIPISKPAAIAGGATIGFGGLLSMKNVADRANPNRRQQKQYLDKLDRLYREQIASPTIRELPFTDEELLAMELYKQEGNRKAPKAEVKPLEVEEPQVIPEGAEVVDMDDEDIKNIMGEL